MRSILVAVALVLAAGTALLAPALVEAQTVTGGSEYQPGAPTTTPAPTTPGVSPLPVTAQAIIGPDGNAVAPESAPKKVRQIIAAGNRIANKPYVYGGGHRSWRASGYDCSGSVSYALRGAGLLKSPLSSGDFIGWGQAGEGDWVTLYTKASHMYMVVAGLRFDTSGRSRTGSRWQTAARPSRGYVVRHPRGL